MRLCQCFDTPHLSLPNYWIFKIDFHNVLAVMNGNIKIKKSNCPSRTAAPVKRFNISKK